MSKRKGDGAVKDRPKKKSRSRGRFPLAKLPEIDYEAEFRTRKLRFDYGTAEFSESCAGCDHARRDVSYRNGNVRKWQCALIGIGDYDAAEVDPKSRCRRFTFKRI